MPRVKIDYVVSFSSEDPDNPASNLLGWDVSKKRWLCPKGEPSCSVVLQLPRAVKVNAVHVGAHQAALVEVLAGRSETPNEPFQVLVPSCVFLSPAESRRQEHAERVRSFGAEQLAAPARAQRWDRLRLVCTQPYNKHCKYGLNFVHVYSDEGPQGASAAPALPARLLAPGDASSEDEFTPGELFAAHRPGAPAPAAPRAPADTGAQIRRATSDALRRLSESASKLVKTPISKPEARAECAPRPEPAGRARPALLYTDDDDRPHDRIDRVVRRHREERTKEDANRPEIAERHHSDRDKSESSRKETRKDESKNESKAKRKSRGERTPKDDEKSKPLAAIEYRNEQGASDRLESEGDRKRPRDEEDEDPAVLRGVVCALSGYAHPVRGQVRALALALGARCERDWGERCTHLICAFPNTPKLRAVRAGAGGAATPVVTAAWLEACRARRRRLPWEWFATEPHRRRDPPAGDDEECDTDDEIERALRKQKKRRTEEGGDERPRPRVTARDDDDDDDDTADERDAEAGAEVIDPAAALPELFAGRAFLLHASAPRLLRRYVRAYGGLVLDESQLDDDSSVDYVLSRRAIARRGAACVRPAWLWRCHRERRLLPPGDDLLA